MRCVLKNRCSYFFYPKISHRSLEEVDLIFAKGYYENILYMKAAKEPPKIIRVRDGTAGDSVWHGWSQRAN